jgi:WhiB family redox-sensing transcriptional regulator
MSGLSWMLRGLCQGEGVDPELFFPEKGGKATRAKREYCGKCPVKNECLAFALNQMDDCGVGRFGIWGGTSAEERITMLRADKRAKRQAYYAALANAQ